MDRSGDASIVGIGHLVRLYCVVELFICRRVWRLGRVDRARHARSGRVRHVGEGLGRKDVLGSDVGV